VVSVLKSDLSTIFEGVYLEQFSTVQ